jgi:orotate phosphoribosyltransferase
MQKNLLSLLPVQRGHFRLESGHHGDLWLDLELLCLRPRHIRQLTTELANRLEAHKVEAVCGPLVEGAFVGLEVAAELDIEFSYAERIVSTQSNELFAVQYRLPDALRSAVRGKRVVIVNDVINAGSAVRGTFADLIACGAQPIAVAALLVLGSSALNWTAEHGMALEILASAPNPLWLPTECPLCSSGVPLEDYTSARPSTLLNRRPAL